MVTVSVIIASYNYEQYLSSAIESVLAQTFQDFELIIVDDGSIDESVRLAEQYAHKDSRIRVMCHPDKKNHGLPATLALGISAAQGAYTAFLESDDLWTPDCLEKRIDIARRTRAGIIFNAIELLVMGNVDTTWYDACLAHKVKTYVPDKPEQTFHAAGHMLIENIIPTFSCAMVETRLLHSCDFQAPVPRWIDWWIWSQLARKTSLVHLASPLTRWRIHADSFNHKIPFGVYLHDCKMMWRGFRTKFAFSDWKEGRRLQAVILYFPYWFRMIVRLGTTIKFLGAGATIKAIRRKF